MVDAWWIAAAAGLGILVGASGVLVLAALIKTQPMTGQHWTGDTHTAAVRQMFKEPDERRDQ